MVWRRVVEGALAGRCCQPCRSALLVSPVGQPSPARVSPGTRGDGGVPQPDGVDRQEAYLWLQDSGFKTLASRLWLQDSGFAGLSHVAVAVTL